MDHAGFARALLGPDPVAGRMAVYRNNVHVGLIGALRARFPVTEALVGPEFFATMARAHLRQSPPQTPVLSEWGDDFPAHVAGFANVPPYLADLARLEAAWTRAYHAADLGPLTLAALSLETPLTLHPAAQLVTSVWPIGTIWAAHQGDPAPVTAKGAEAVLICRPALTVGVHVLPPADLPFVAALFHGAPLEEAAEQAMTNPDFDFGRALTGLVRLGAFGETR